MSGKTHCLSTSETYRVSVEAYGMPTGKTNHMPGKTHHMPGKTHCLSNGETYRLPGQTNSMSTG